MKLSDLSIKRPVMATMLNVVLVIFGFFSLPKLSVDIYPSVDFPVVTVLIPYPGADPASVEKKVLVPLEEALNGISGLKGLSSNAFPNNGQIILTFNLEKNSNEASQQVRDKVFAAISKLPSEAKTPIVQKFDIGGTPIVNIALKGDLDLSLLSSIAKDIVQPSLERIDGVASINPSGLREREVQILVNRERLSSFGLSPQDLINSIKQQNFDLPSGKVLENTNYQAIRVSGKLLNVEELERLPIMNNNHSNVRISDVALVKDTIVDEENAAFVGDIPTIIFSIQKQSDANTTKVASLVKEEIAKLNKSLPNGASLEVVTDNSLFIESSINAVKLDLVLGAILAVFIVLLFLRDFRITLISAIALPTSVIATFAFMDYMGFTLNMMTTLALSLSIGILIDDAIIVVENIHRHLMMKKSGKNAAMDATKEIGLAVIATTLTLCAVFVPVGLMEGIIGRFFFQFGLTVAFSVLVSLFVAFTLTPMLSSRFLKHGEGLIIFKRFNDFLDRLDKSYKNLLSWCLNHRTLTLLSGLGIFVLSILMLKFVPVSFFPREDRSEFAVDYVLPEGTNLNATKNKSLILQEAIKKYPGVKEVVTTVASSHDKKVNKAHLDVKLVDKGERKFSQSELMERLRLDLNQFFEIDGAEISLTNAQGGGGGPPQPIQFVFKSDNWNNLVEFTEKVSNFTKNEVKGAVEVTTTKPKSQKEYKVAVDTLKSADLGITSSEIASTIRSLFEGEKVGNIELDDKNIDIKMRLSDENRTSALDIADISIASRQGKYIPLNSVATIKESISPSNIERLDGQRQITLLANFTGKNLNFAVDQIKDFVDKNLPEGVSVKLSGQAEIMKDSIVAMLRALLLAIILVFVVLCIQYESYSSPLVIMAALPLSLTGAFGSLLITGQVMSVYTMIGIILLMGLVTKNGILLIDFTMQKIREGMKVNEALLTAGPLRLRPILMTTFAAGGGMLPVAIGHGVGGEARSPMGVAVIGGLLVSTLLTLVIVPCLFSVVEDFKVKLSKKIKSKESEIKEEELVRLI